MCRAETGINEGRRCNKHNPYGIKSRNLQAQKQYHSNKIKNAKLTSEQQAKTSLKLEKATIQLEELQQEKRNLGTVKPYVMNLTITAEKILSQLEQDGLNPYIVGGSVRDELMNLDSKDIDIEVYGGDADTIIKSLRKIGKVDEVGKSFGVLKITVGDEDFDVSLPRLDNKTGDGHKGFEVEVRPDLSLEEATARRDFTINALMYSHRLGFIIDKHGGLKDLENRKLRHVSEAFDEDPLRVLRGVQMASRFGMDLDESTIIKAQTLKTQYSDLAVERVQIEFQKLYEKGLKSQKALKLLKKTQWDENFPGLTEVNNKSLRKTVKNMQKIIVEHNVSKIKKAVLLSAVISHRLEEKNRYIFLSSTTVGDAVKNAAYEITTMNSPEKISEATVKQWAYDIPRNVTLEDWSLYQKAIGNKKLGNRVLSLSKKLKVQYVPEKDLINGNDLLALFPDRKPGPWLKDALSTIRSAQYENKFNNVGNGLKWVTKNSSSILDG